MIKKLREDAHAQSREGMGKLPLPLREYRQNGKIKKLEHNDK